MPDVTCERSVSGSLDRIWPFVADIDRWAPMMSGYVGHERHDDRASTWTLRGDLGPMSRTVQLSVRITEWVDAQRVVFTLDGIDEQVTGGGSFELSETPPPQPPAPPPRRSWWQRLIDWFTGYEPALPAPAGPGTTHVVFRFRIEALGPMGPMINAMLGPYAESVARQLLDDVGAALEQQEKAA